MKNLDFFLALGKLKDLERTGWKNHDVKNPESVSDHCFRTAMLAMIYAKDEGCDVNKCVKMALIHDIQEVYTGDIPSDPKTMLEMGAEKKMKIEESAMKKLLAKLPAEDKDELYSLWRELEGQKTNEAKFVNDMDKIEMVIQAFEYRKNRRTENDLEQFFQTSEKRIKTETGKKLWQEIRKEFLAI